MQSWQDPPRLPGLSNINEIDRQIRLENLLVAFFWQILNVHRT